MANLFDERVRVHAKLPGDAEHVDTIIDRVRSPWLLRIQKRQTPKVRPALYPACRADGPDRRLGAAFRIVEHPRDDLPGGLRHQELPPSRDRGALSGLAFDAFPGPHQLRRCDVRSLAGFV